MRLILTALAWLGMTTASNAAFYTGNEFLEMCERGPAMALGYVAAISDMHDLSVIQEASGIRICIPEGATLGQLRDLVCKSIKDSPEDRHIGAHVLTTKALLDAYPCDPE